MVGGYRGNRVEILVGDVQKQKQSMAESGEPRLTLKDYLYDKAPQNWAELEVNGKKWTFYLSAKLGSDIQYTEGKQSKTAKPGQILTLTDGDEIQIGGIEYRIDTASGQLQAVRAEHSGKITANLSVPSDQAIEAAAQNDRGGRIKQKGAADTNSPAKADVKPPPALDPHTAKDFPEFSKQTVQMSYQQFSKSLRRDHLDVIRAKSESSGYEFASVAIEFNGLVATGENPVTSHNERMVEGKEYVELFRHAVTDLLVPGGPSKDTALKIYNFHTHPGREVSSNLVRSPNGVHQDGVPFTLTNDADWKAYQALFKVYVHELREQGWTGPIEMVSGVIPTRVSKTNPDVKADLAKEPYVAVTTMRVEAGKMP